jgi:hypothetical protein
MVTEVVDLQQDYASMHYTTERKYAYKWDK